MHKLKAVWLCAALAALSAGCKVSVTGDGGRRLEGAGVVFLVPLQSANAEFGTTGINYRSDTISASTDGKQLIVNGKSYGPLQAGDVVDLTDVHIVKINAQPATTSDTRL